MSFGQTLKSYLLWTHPRGGFHYDVMVTLILAFIFLTPRSVFQDTPRIRSLNPGEIVLHADGSNGFIFDISASAVSAHESDQQAALARAIAPIAGNVEITRYEPLHDAAGKITGYRVWTRK